MEVDVPIFIAHVSLWDGQGTLHSFAPGDPVPDWADVDEHVIDQEDHANQVTEPEHQAEPVRPAQPDFTKPRGKRK